MPRDTNDTPETPDGLVYADSSDAGLMRCRTRGGFDYRDAAGLPVKDEATLERIRRLAVPPAWTQVWICADPRGHIQAVGRDARGRKQYRYHPAWRATRDEAKFDRVAAFGRALPRLRRRVDADLRRRGPPREEGLARVVARPRAAATRVGK